MTVGAEAPKEQGGGGRAAWRAYTLAGAVLCLVYAAWYAVIWPGPVGVDGYAVVLWMQGDIYNVGKEVAWLLYALATYGTTHRIEVAVLPLLLLHVAIFTRMIGWMALQGWRWLALLMLVLIACTPHVLLFASIFYPDSAFSLAFVAVLFEVWLACRRGRLSGFSLCWLALLFPVAVLFRTNGLLLLLPLAYLAWRFKGRGRWALVSIAAFWLGLTGLAETRHEFPPAQSALRSLVLFETANFMQSRPMGLWINRDMVTERTRETIHRYVSQEDLDRLFDRDYWDTLWHQNIDRVRFHQMSNQEMSDLIRDFLTYNVWRNIPAFVSSRVNVFLATAMGQGGVSGPLNGDYYLGLLPESRSTYNPLGLDRAQRFADSAFSLSHLNLRFLTWTPFVGLFMLLMLARRSWRERDTASGLIAAVLVIQLAAIFLFSTAAEYRYLLIFFFLPLLLVPMLRRGPAERSWSRAA